MPEPHDVRSGPPPAAARWGAVGALSACVAVLAGAFGGHALKSRLTPDLLAVFETAARYQMFHALALLAVAWALERGRHPALVRAAWLFLAGTALFSGSLYALALTGARGLGAVTPLGGLCFIAGWLSLAWGLWRGRAT
jgi:uncharacterized membrane protein YgdD (TMEM256/DUF423 family)